MTEGLTNRLFGAIPYNPVEYGFGEWLFSEAWYLYGSMSRGADDCGIIWRRTVSQPKHRLCRERCCLQLKVVK